MVEVIPAILVKRHEEFESLVRKFEPHVSRVHLDIIDGEFANNKTFNGYEEVKLINTTLDFDIHLMVRMPSKYMQKWYETKADRFILHQECQEPLAPLLSELRNHGKRGAIALNPSTGTETISGLEHDIDFLQFMTVNPGFYGGNFIPDVLEKIKKFHTQFPNVKIGVDGGITPETGPRACAAGASILVCGSYLASSDNLVEDIQLLKNC